MDEDQKWKEFENYIQAKFEQIFGKLNQTSFLLVMFNSDQYAFFGKGCEACAREYAQRFVEIKRHVMHTPETKH